MLIATKLMIAGSIAVVTMGGPGSLSEPSANALSSPTESQANASLLQRQTAPACQQGCDFLQLMALRH